MQPAYLVAKLSATTALAPPGPMSLAMVVNRCAVRISKSLITAKAELALYAPAHRQNSLLRGELELPESIGRNVTTVQTNVCKYIT
jgi:hypothetical protein